jgi:hypothetical protein
MYYIISKIELDGTDSLKYSDYATTEIDEVAIQINEDYDATLGKFLAENRTKLNIGEVSVSTFFETTSFVYEARTQVENVDDLNLLSITDFNQL